VPLCFVYIASHRRPLFPAKPLRSRRLCVRFFPRLSPNSFPANLFADPHPLTPIASIFYRNLGGEGAATLQSPFPISNLLPHIPLSIYPLFFHSLMKCRFCNPFVLIFMHVMGGGAPLPPFRLSPTPCPYSTNSFRMNTYEKHGGEEGVMVNQRSERCLSRATAGSEGSLLESDGDSWSEE
jgi:hypothetical protein